MAELAAATSPATKVDPTPQSWSRSNPFPARLSVNRTLCGEGSDKDTRHLELDISSSGLSYEPGDSMAVWPTNDPPLVDEIMKAIGARGDEPVKSPKGETNLHEALFRHCQITHPTPKFLKLIAQRVGTGSVLPELIQPDRKEDLDRYLWGMEVIDFLVDHPSLKVTPQELVETMPKLQPRLYSIASSLKAFPGQVHFTLDVVSYESHGRLRKGVCSTFLAERAGDTPVPVYPTTAKHFHLPEDGNASIVMVGPGTGIAPFRAFLQERKATGAEGRNWLFFGSQKASCNYFYEDEFADLQKEGVLTRIDTAFSRDQTHKVYVQHRMLENAADLWKWLDEGAYFYVCGDAKRMAKDVDAALRKIVQEQGGLPADKANEYVEKLKADKRYKRDVY